MVTTTVDIALASNGCHEISTKRALGSSAQDAAKAEEMANLYVSHCLPSKVSGRLTLSVQQSENGDFTHSVMFTSARKSVATRLEQELVNSDAPRHDKLRPELDGAGDKLAAGKRRSTNARQPGVNDSASPPAPSTHRNTTVSDLPCLKCAKRIIHDSKSQSATIAEKNRPDLDGTVRMEAYRCRRKKDKNCSYCQPEAKPCLEACSSSCCKVCFGTNRDIGTRDSPRVMFRTT